MVTVFALAEREVGELTRLSRDPSFSLFFLSSLSLSLSLSISFVLTLFLPLSLSLSLSLSFPPFLCFSLFAYLLPDRSFVRHISLGIWFLALYICRSFSHTLADSLDRAPASSFPLFLSLSLSM